MIPGFDRTGPMGAGPMTGGAKGRCIPANTGIRPTYSADFGYGRARGPRRGSRGGIGPGWARGRGFGRGYRRYSPAANPAEPTDAASEMDMLKAEAAGIQKSLEAVKKRLDEIGEKHAAGS